MSQSETDGALHTHDGQYEYRVTEDGETIDRRVIDDPFVNTTIVFTVSRWAAFRILLRGMTKTFRVHVSGTQAAYRVVFGSEYPEPPEAHPVQTMGVSNDES